MFLAVGGGAVATAQIAGSDTPETVLKMRVTKDGKLIGTDNDGTVKKAGVGIYDITFTTGAGGRQGALDLERCAVVATTRVETPPSPRRSPPTSSPAPGRRRASSSSRPA